MSDANQHDQEVVSQFTQQAEAYARLTAAMPGDRTAALRGLIAASATDRALDVACGPGSLAIELAPFVEHVTGVDLTPAMLAQARLEQNRRGLRNLDWQLANACQLPFEAGTFSLVLCRAAVHHMPAPRQALAEMARVCRAGGRIAVIDVTPAPDKAQAYDAIEKMRDPSHAHAHTVDELRALGDGLPLHAPVVTRTVTADVPLEAVLATSYPEQYTLAEIRAVFEQDAASGADRLGVNARMIGGRLCVSYSQATVVWTRA
jgi:ubiquinone/menaquinone biosynthesis C-methylase UbiE